MTTWRRPAVELTKQQKRILWHLRINGPLPRIQLADALGMNSASMTRATQQMIALGVVEERDTAGSLARGRPMVPIAISGHGGWAAGATVHPGWLELVFVDFAGHPLSSATLPFDSPDPRIFARTLEQQLRVLAADNGFMRGRFLGLGVAVPGYALNGDRNRRKVVDRLDGWNDVPLDQLFGDILDMPVWIENDGTAAALAEFYHPAIIGRYRSVQGLFLGHGVGAGLIAERDLFAGEHGNAGEIGRLFPPDCPRPSGIDLLDTLRSAGADVRSLTDIGALLDGHAPVIGEWVERAAHQLDLAIISGVVWLDPGAVVISGALPLPILQAIAARLNELGATRDRRYMGAVPAVYASPIGSAAVVIGAAMAPIHAVSAPGD